MMANVAIFRRVLCSMRYRNVSRIEYKSCNQYFYRNGIFAGEGTAKKICSVFIERGFSRSSVRPYIQKLEDPLTYEKVSDETLEELSDYLENCFQDINEEELDVSLSSGVLTISLGKSIGTYVINKQSPNKQIWLSSPISGPKRFDFMDGKWTYSHDRSNLHELIEKELSESLNYKFDMKNLEYYNFSLDQGTL